jgi:hypothetical protein
VWCVCVRGVWYACVRAMPQEQLSIDHDTDECVLCEGQHEVEERVNN